MDSPTACPHYHLPYRGLPPEIRSIIWKFYFQQQISIQGPFLPSLSGKLANGRQASMKRSDGVYYARDDFCTFGTPKPRVALYFVNKAIYQEAKQASAVTPLYLEIADASEKNIEWALSVLPRHVRERVDGFKINFDHPWPRDYHEYDYDMPIGLLDGLLSNFGALNVKEITISTEIMNEHPTDYDEDGYEAYWVEEFRLHWESDVAAQIADILVSDKVQKVILQLPDAPEEFVDRLEHRTIILSFFLFTNIPADTLNCIDADIKYGGNGPEWHFTKASSELAWEGASEDDEWLDPY